MGKIKIIVFGWIFFLIIFGYKVDSYAQNNTPDNAEELTEEGTDILFEANTFSSDDDLRAWYVFSANETNFYTFTINNPYNLFLLY